MKIKEKIMLDREGLLRYGPINIVILGDSVSHGALNGCMDYENVYYNRLKKMLNAFRDYVPVNMINASIGGTMAAQALSRLDSQVLKHEPDLVIVCFGLNDVNGSLEDYLSSLEKIFKRCKDKCGEVIFMTPNMLNTYVCEDTHEQYRDYAAKTAEMQNGGRMDEYMSAAVELAKNVGVTVCDCYSKWKELSKEQDTTALLVNGINHPVSEMHALFADSLYELIIGDGQAKKTSDTAMFEG